MTPVTLRDKTQSGIAGVFYKVLYGVPEILYLTKCDGPVGSQVLAVSGFHLSKYRRLGFCNGVMESAIFVPST
jgi:hypothetical protein